MSQCLFHILLFKVFPSLPVVFVVRYTDTLFSVLVLIRIDIHEHDRPLHVRPVHFGIVGLQDFSSFTIVDNVLLVLFRIENV